MNVCKKKFVTVFCSMLLVTSFFISTGCNTNGESTVTTVVEINALNQLRGDVTESGGGDGGVLASRKDNYIVLYTPDWYATTMMTNDPNDSVSVCEVVIKPESVAVRSGSAINASVVSITDDDIATETGSKIESNCWILSGYDKGAQALRKLTVGQKITVNFNVNAAWTDIITTFGGGRHDGGPLLVANGIAVPEESHAMQTAYGSASWYDKNPRTAIGIMNDGSYFLFTDDGRNQGGSQGLSIEDMKKILIDIGVQDAFNLDGGGSTQFIVNDGGSLLLKNTPFMPNTGRKISEGIYIVVPTATLITNAATESDSVTWDTSGYSGTAAAKNLAKGIKWSKYEVTDSNAIKQNINLLTVNPVEAPKARIVLGFNSGRLYAAGGDTNVLDKANWIVSNGLAADESIIGGTNGDFYDTVTYTPCGFTQQNGKWLTSGEYGLFETQSAGLYTTPGYAFGVSSDGSVKIGQPNVSINFEY